MCVCVCVCVCVQTTTAGTTVTRRAVATPAPAFNSSAIVAAASPSTGPATETTTAETTATRRTPTAPIRVSVRGGGPGQEVVRSRGDVTARRIWMKYGCVFWCVCVWITFQDPCKALSIFLYTIIYVSSCNWPVRFLIEYLTILWYEYLLKVCTVWNLSVCQEVSLF